MVDADGYDVALALDLLVRDYLVYKLERPVVLDLYDYLLVVVAVGGAGDFRARIAIKSAGMEPVTVNIEVN